MKILISNDDGIHAPGIKALYRAIHDLGEIHVVAPHSEQSAVSHGITLANPLKTTRVSHENRFFGHAVGGTPADSVKLAIGALLEQPPDLLVSGINLGPNAGIAVLYSGTVSAAAEGTILGIPSMAVSINTFTDPIWETATHVARHLVGQIQRHGLPADTLLNVNVPNLPLDQVKGYAVTRMGRSRYVEIFHRRTDPRGNVYYWMDGALQPVDCNGGTDLEALQEGYVALTPIWFDLTHDKALGAFKQWDLGKVK